MKYPKIFVGDILIIDGIEYVATMGIHPEMANTVKKKKYNKFIYHIVLTSVRFNLSEKGTFYTLNTELPPFTVKKHV